MPLKQLAVLLLGLVFAGVELGYNTSRYTILNKMVVYGSGTVDREVFTKSFRVIPDVAGWQRLVNITLLVNSKPVVFSLLNDDDGNRFVYPGDLAFSGMLNITLVQVVEVARPPFRKIAGMPEYLEQRPVNIDELSKSPFWGCRYRDTNFTSIVKLSNEIYARSANIREYILKTAEWVHSNIKYNLSMLGGVQCPAKTFAEKEGACADVHSLLTLLLRIKGVDAYLAYAYVFQPQENITQNADKWTYSLINVEPHVFTVVNSSSTTFPIDVTATTGSAGNYVEGAAINQLDNVILVGWITKSSPDSFLAIYGPNGAERISFSVEIRETTEYYSSLVVLVVALIVAGALIVNKERSI